MKETQKLEDEVAKLYGLLHQREAGIISGVFELPKPVHPESKRILSRYVAAPYSLMILLFLFGWFIYPNDALKVVVIVLLLVGYVGIIAFQLLEIYAERGTLYQMLKNPLALYTKSLVEDPEFDVFLAESLKGFSSEALRIVRARLETDQKAIVHRLGATVGSLDKVGVIPGFFSLYVAASASAYQKFAVGAAAAVFFIYMFAYAIHQVWPRLSMYLNFIQAELKRRKDEL